MQKCPKCGKKFNTLQALSDHFRTVHPNQRFVAPKQNTSRNLIVGLVVVIIVIGVLVGALIYYNPPSTTATTSSGLLRQPISLSLYDNLTTVSFATLSAVGSGGSDVTAPSTISSSSLTNGSKPEILYIGAEFCPYCAAERWVMVVALSKFGNFSNLEYMQSAPDDGNISTLTFLNSNYVSKYISFVSVEDEDQGHNALQNPTSSETALWNEFNANSFPFVDVGGQYDITTSQYAYSALSGLNWTQIGSRLNDPSSPTAVLIDGAANTLIKAVCSLTNNNPSSVCGQHYLSTVNAAYQVPSASGTLSQTFQTIFKSDGPSVMNLGKHPF